MDICIQASRRLFFVHTLGCQVASLKEEPVDIRYFRAGKVFQKICCDFERMWYREYYDVILGNYESMTVFLLMINAEKCS